MKRRRGKSRLGMVRQAGYKSDDFTVHTCPTDAEVGLPLWNKGARFSRQAVAAMVLDGAFAAGTVLRQKDRLWLVEDGRLCELRRGAPTGRELCPKESRDGERVMWVQAPAAAD